MSPCSRRSAGARAAGDDRSRNRLWLVLLGLASSRRAPGAQLPAVPSGKGLLPLRSVPLSPRHPRQRSRARRCRRLGHLPASNAAARFPRAHNRGLVR